MGLTLDRVSRHFGEHGAVHDASLTVEPGQIVALVGLNGAGKTTLLRLGLGMLKPDEGSVRLGGQPLSSVPAASWRRVGHLVEAASLYSELTARQNLQLTATLRSAPSATVDAAIERWRLHDSENKRARRLSLGTRQRVALAAALAHEPDLVVLDEPSNALDPAGVVTLRDVVLERAAAGAAILISSHHLDEVARVADRIVVMNRGELVDELPPGAPEIERAFFAALHADDRRRGLA